MANFINILNDLIIILGNIIIFSCMLNFKELKKTYKLILSIACVFLMVMFSLCVYLWDMAYMKASVICFTIPTIILFWIFSKVKDSRFFLTFCIVDTVSLVIGFLTKLISLVSNSIYASLLTLIINLILYTLIIIKGYKFFVRYSELMKFRNAGWTSMMIASFIIYFALCFIAIYPVPIKERAKDYALPYFVFCCVVISCYVVFLDSILKTKKLHDQYKELEKEKHFHQIAYKDSLTNLYNRVYYIEKINEIERNHENYKKLCCIVLDINNFKFVNDKYGHHVGDEFLKFTAEKISEVFKETSSFIFRMGGDEFFILTNNILETDVKEKLNSINSIIETNPIVPELKLTVSSGYDFIDMENNEKNLTIEQTFVTADKCMYNNKKIYKLTHAANEYDYNEEKITY